MRLLEKIINLIATSIHPTLVIEEQEIESGYEKHNSCSTYDYKKPHVTVINPASGLPMVSGFDIAGNVFGTNHSSDDYHRRSHEDSYKSSSISYDNSYQYDYWRN